MTTVGTTKTFSSTNSSGFKFSPCFKKYFDQMIGLYQKSLDQLNNIVKNNCECEYGYCNKKYSMRLITPNDISSFAGNLINAFNKGLLGYNINDVNMFSVASAKRFIDEHDDTPFEDSNMNGPVGSMYINPKEFTLADLLTVARNEVFPDNLISNYEIGIRCQDIHDDLKRVNDMHFSGVMKSVVNALPASVNLCCKNKPGIFSDGSIIGELFTDTIETFIIFSITLNMITIESMKGYCFPSVDYTTKTKPGVEPIITQESVDTSTNSPVFIVLSEGKTPIISNAIKKKTKCPFSHASISFDPSLRSMYSFASKTVYHPETYKKQGSGFRVESIYSPEYMGKDINIGVYAIYVSNDGIEKMREYLSSYDKAKTSFSWHTIFNKLFDIDKKSDRSAYHQICSSFVNTLLKQADINITDKNVPSPADLSHSLSTGDPNEVIDIFYGNSNDYDVEDTKQKLMSFTKTKESVAFDEMVTECCLIKTNDMMLRCRLPFNCNMRNIVLQDTHPWFKDTLSALAYIMNNPRSPISQLLAKYSTITENEDLSFAGGTVSRMIFHIKDCDFSNTDNGWYSRKYNNVSYENPYKRANFHSDVNWLDKIAYGNPFYEGNYRRDAMGNDSSYSIVIILDNIYHMFDCDRLKDDSDLANHIIRVGNAMKDIIHTYKRNELENQEMVRDVLAVLGEILTRSMLKLYHNNTRTIVCSDAMEDTMIPGYMYIESFVMEADDKPTVEIDRKDGIKSTMHKFTSFLSTLISKFVRWMHDVVAKYLPKFVKNHRLEIKWVEQNKTLNEEIAKALDSNYVVNVANFPDYNVKIEVLDDINVKSTVDDYINNKDLAVDVNEVFKKMLPKGCQLEYSDKDDVNATKIQNFVLYGDINHQPSNSQSKRVTGDEFRTLCRDITDTEKALSKLTDVAKDVNDAANDIQKKSLECEKVMKSAEQNKTDKPDEYNKAQQEYQRIKTLFDVVNKVNSIYAVKIMETVVNKFYKNSYSVYRDIVQGYKQEKNNLENNNNTNQTKPEQTPAKENETPTPTTPAETPTTPTEIQANQPVDRSGWTVTNNEGD